MINPRLCKYTKNNRTVQIERVNSTTFVLTSIKLFFFKLFKSMLIHTGEFTIVKINTFWKKKKNYLLSFAVDTVLFCNLLSDWDFESLLFIFVMQSQHHLPSWKACGIKNVEATLGPWESQAFLGFHEYVLIPHLQLNPPSCIPADLSTSQWITNVLEAM